VAQPLGSALGAATAAPASVGLARCGVQRGGETGSGGTMAAARQRAGDGLSVPEMEYHPRARPGGWMLFAGVDSCSDRRGRLAGFGFVATSVPRAPAGA